MGQLLCSDQPVNALDWLLKSGTCCNEIQSMSQRDFGRGETIFHEGDDCTGMYFLLTGLVGIRRTDIDGCSVLLHLVHPGDPVAYVSLRNDDEYTVTAECLAPVTVGYINKSKFLTILKRDPETLFRFLDRAIRYVGDVDRHTFEMMTLPARERIVQLLLSLTERYGVHDNDGGTVIKLPFSRKEMADIAGIRPGTVSRVVKQLFDEGVAEFNNRTVHVPVLALLRSDSNMGLAA